MEELAWAQEAKLAESITTSILIQTSVGNKKSKNHIARANSSKLTTSWERLMFTFEEINEESIDWASEHQKGLVYRDIVYMIDLGGTLKDIIYIYLS